MSLLLWFRAHPTGVAVIPNLVRMVDGTFLFAVLSDRALAPSGLAAESWAETDVQGDGLVDSA